ncbi:hypothetical protein GCM10009765_41470 [Fodinicola feengrottensis]|uniref:Zinc finger CGNR domain-containing protein n=1 Tax=Fodinicola feengrottensis TaxID=435914 RepID=A0ABN2HGP3_9ACTN
MRPAGFLGGVGPPFRMLDPGLDLAEHLLAGEVPDREIGLSQVVAALPDEDAAAVHLNDSLEILGVRPRLRRSENGWRLAIGEASADFSSELAEAVTMLAVLVAATGWQRIGRCGHHNCGRPFIDRTMGATTRSCPYHRRKTSG